MRVAADRRQKFMFANAANAGLQTGSGDGAPLLWPIAQQITRIDHRRSRGRRLVDDVAPRQPGGAHETIGDATSICDFAVMVAAQHSQQADQAIAIGSLSLRNPFGLRSGLAISASEAYFVRATDNFW